MCMICGRFPCDSRCPNAPDPPMSLLLDKCGATKGVAEVDRW